VESDAALAVWRCCGTLTCAHTCMHEQLLHTAVPLVAAVMLPGLSAI
jgi:hypothetical protein